MNKDINYIPYLVAYSRYVKRRLYDAEKDIKDDPCYAYVYARDVVKGRWLDAEEIIKTDPWFTACYARDVIKGRWLESEDIIKTRSDAILLYSVDVIRDRWIDAEHCMDFKTFTGYLNHWYRVKSQAKRLPVYAIEYNKTVIRT